MGTIGHFGGCTCHESACDDDAAGLLAYPCYLVELSCFGRDYLWPGDAALPISLSCTVAYGSEREYFARKDLDQMSCGVVRR